MTATDPNTMTRKKMTRMFDLISSRSFTSGKSALLGLALCVFMTAAAGAQEIIPNEKSSDPCPSPKGAMANTPGDMAKVQEEIDRFTLCVERAQLVERLNSLVEKNLETVDSVLIPATTLPPLPVGDGTSPGMPGLPGAQGGTMMPAPTGNTVSPISENDIANSVADRISKAQAEIPGMMPEEPQEPEWQIREIYGIGNSLQARLLSTEGKIARVRQGDVLPDESRVIEVSKTRVKIKKDKEEIDLDWVNNAPAEEQ